MIEDDETIGTAVAERLRSEGFTVDVAGDGLAGVELVTSTSPDLVVLDLMLPGIDGLELCRRIRRELHTPVIMLTARDDEVDQLTGLAVGADDYLTKPFSQRVLVARVNAQLRRVESWSEPTMVRVGQVEIDTGRRTVRCDGIGVQLTTRTSPSTGSTSTTAPSGRCSAPAAPITAGMPSSRAITAAWLSGPPSVVTTAPAMASTVL